MTDPTSSVSHLDLEESKHTFLDANELILNMGPQHPATHGVLRVILRLDGEKVMGLECVIGYLHRDVQPVCRPHGLRRCGFEWARLLRSG